MSNKDKTMDQKELGGSVRCEFSIARGNDIGCTHPDLDMSVTTGLHQEY